MANLMFLPCEIISQILIPENIDIEDVVNLSLTCKRLYTMINDDYIWRWKLLQRWPSLKKVHEDRLNNDESIMELMKEGMKYEKELLCCLSILPYIYNTNDTNQTFRKKIARLDFVSPTDEDTSPLKCYYCHDKLIKLMEADPSGTHINLTNTYYAKKFIVLMKQIDGRNTWRKLRHHHEYCAHQVLERVTTLIAQWFQPYKLVLHSDVAASLDIIVQQILEVLKEVYPAHSICATSAEKLISLWKNQHNWHNYWNGEESRQIIDIIGRVIFYELNFTLCCVNSDETYVDPNIFFIDQVLESKRASPVLLKIIIQSVASRLGIRCDLLYSSNHLVLSWRESYRDNTDLYYIDLFSGGSLVSKEDFRYHLYQIDSPMCLTRHSDWSCGIDIRSSDSMKCIPPFHLVLYITNNLGSISGYADKYVTQSCWMIELLDMVQELSRFKLRDSYCHLYLNDYSSYYIPYVVENCDDRAMLPWSNWMENYMPLRSTMYTDYQDIQGPIKLDLTDCILFMLSEAHISSPLSYRQKIQSRLTRRHLKYTIGMLVEIQSPFKSAGVITGWTSDCSNCSLYLSWPRFGDISEPHMCTMCTVCYEILACNDVEINVSQEFLKPLKMQKWIDNTEIGRYFSHFEGTHYVPNQKLRMLYPMDVHILKKKYSKS